MPTEDDIIKRADEILQKSTGQHPKVRKPAPTGKYLVRERLSSTHRQSVDQSDTEPYEQRRIDQMLTNLYSARWILREAFEACEKSSLPPPEWAVRVQKLISEAIKKGLQ